jgi:hypothetical protein
MSIPSNVARHRIASGSFQPALSTDELRRRTGQWTGADVRPMVPPARAAATRRNPRMPFVVFAGLAGVAALFYARRRVRRTRKAVPGLTSRRS